MLSFGDPLNRLERFRRFGAADNRNTPLDDAGFFKSYLVERIAQPLLVIVLDVGNDAGQRRYNVRCVQSAPETGFPNHEVATLLGEILQSHHRDDFKEGRMGISSKLLEQRL